MYVVYVLKSKIAKKSYVGVTADLERRIDEHNAGKNSYTMRYLPWEIIHTEEYTKQGEAIKREKYLKSTSGRRFLKRVFDNLTFE